jgi:hypothetical protein
MGSMYASVIFMGVQNSGSVQPVVSVERTVFYRERAAHMYSPLPYALGQVKFIAIHYILNHFKIKVKKINEPNRDSTLNLVVRNNIRCKNVYIQDFMSSIKRWYR